VHGALVDQPVIRARRTGQSLTVIGTRMLRHLPVALLIVAYVVHFGLLSVQVHDGYGTPGYDMGIFDQGVWLLSRFHAPFVTVMGRNLFGDHTSFILLLAVPLYWVWPRAQTLLVLQTCLLAAAAVPIYLLALRRTRSAVIATGLAAAYLLNPALQNGNLEQFHPEAFLVLFVALALYAAVESRPVLLAVSVAGALLVKEDAALLMVPLAVWVFFRRNRAWGVKIALAAVAWTAFAYEVVIAGLLGTVSFYADRIPFGGVGPLVTTVVAHPVKFWRYARGDGRLFYLWQMGAAFAFGFLVAPELAAVAALVITENTLSTFPYMHQILYHYSMPTVAVLAMGTAFAVGALTSAGRRYLATGVVVAAAFTSCLFWGLAPFSRQSYPHADPHSAQVAAINSVLRLVPAHAVVSAYYPYVAHLDHRTRIYQWPTPFRAEYWGLYRQEGQRLPFAGEVQYVVVPVDLSPSDQLVMDSIAKQYVAIGQRGGVIVYRRRAG
jgi:uncharacterized membrane protein